MIPKDSPTSLPDSLFLTLKERGFDELTSVQAAVLAALEERPEGPIENLRISSQTGSGKTVALGMALAAGLNSHPAAGPGKPRALVITPTRELANQVSRELSWFLSGLPGTNVGAFTGGTEVRGDKQRLRPPPTVVVATPGRLLDHIRSKALSCEQIGEVVLDEADQLLDMGFRDELDAIIAALPEQRRSHLVSATFSPHVRALAEKFQGTKARRVMGTELGQANADIEHVAYLVHARQRYAALVNLLLVNRGQRTLVFVQRRDEANELCEALAADGLFALPFSGELAQAQRTRALGAFRAGSVATLVATDVAARGIDVPDISTVIHLDPPRDPDTYTHRSGRTGRAGRAGRSLMLVSLPAQARARRLLAAARVRAQWAKVPSAKSIAVATTKDARRALYERLGSTEPPTAELEYANNLLSQHDPATLVATLIKLSEHPPARQPFELILPEERWVPGRGVRGAPPNDRAQGRPRRDPRDPARRARPGPPRGGGHFGPRPRSRGPGSFGDSAPTAPRGERPTRVKR